MHEKNKKETLVKYSKIVSFVLNHSSCLETKSQIRQTLKLLVKLEKCKISADYCHSTRTEFRSWWNNMDRIWLHASL